MAKEKGLDILVSLNTGTHAVPVWVVLGGQRGATLNRSGEVIDMTDKNSAGWKENAAGFKEWSVDCDGFYVTTDTAFTALETAYENGTQVEIKVAKTAGISYIGYAIITDFPVELPYDDAMTYSISFTGTTALA